jgi:flagellar assembly factor FliW
MRSNMIRQFILVAIVSSIPFSTSLAQKLVDPDKVAPEYRVAAEKRRAEQLKVQECSHRADAAKVLPRDRTAHIQQCLDEP